MGKYTNKTYNLEYYRSRKRYNEWRKTLGAWQLLAKMYREVEGKCPDCKLEMILPEYKVYSEHPRKATFDHIIPLSITKKNDKNNLTIKCHDCNCKKGSASVNYITFTI